MRRRREGAPALGIALLLVVALWLCAKPSEAGTHSWASFDLTNQQIPPADDPYTYAVHVDGVRVPVAAYPCGPRQLKWCGDFDAAPGSRIEVFAIEAGNPLWSLASNAIVVPLPVATCDCDRDGDSVVSLRDIADVMDDQPLNMSTINACLDVLGERC